MSRRAITILHASVRCNPGYIRAAPSQAATTLPEREQPILTRHAFTGRIFAFIRRIPAGKVATYGQIAAMAGNPRAARQVARALHACSQKEGLPWHRVVNREGRIALETYAGGAEQKRLLEIEGVEFDPAGVIDLDAFLWRPATIL